MRFWWLVFGVAACSGSKTEPSETEDTGPTTTPDTDDTDPPTGSTEEGVFTLAVRFAIDPDYVPSMDEPPVGRFWGDVYRTSEVSGIGPNPDAEALIGISVLDDITLPEDGSPTDVLITVEATGPNSITILGFLDSDANADVAGPGPDDKDPVTLPGDNAFDVTLGAETEVTVFFGLLNP